MKQIKYLMVLAISLIASVISQARGLKLPESQDPVEFSRQLESMIIDSVAKDLPILEFQGSRNELIENDSRNWEATLAKIVADPGKYGSSASRISLDLIKYRKKEPTSSEVTAAVIKLFQFEKNSALQKMDEYVSQGEAIDYYPRSIVGTFISHYLSIQSPELLQEVLSYFDSEEEARLGVINDDTAAVVVEAIRAYGDERHLDGARKFIERLRKVGKKDLANDIERSIERIEKDAARKASGNGDRGSSGPNPAKADAEEHSAEKENKAPWIVTIIAGCIALIGAFIFFRRKG